MGDKPPAELITAVAAAIGVKFGPTRHGLGGPWRTCAEAAIRAVREYDANPANLCACGHMHRVGDSDGGDGGCPDCYCEAWHPRAGT